MRRLAGILIAVALLMAGHPARAQTQPVQLQVKGSRGDTVHYATTSTAETTLSGLLPQPQNFEFRTEAREVHRILENAPDGTIRVEVVLEDLKATFDGKTEESLDEPWVMRVTPNGKVVDPGPGRPRDYPIPLPDRPVAPGDSWSRQAPVTEEGVTGQVTTTYTLESVDRSGSTPIARIRSRIQGTVTEFGAATQPSRGQAQSRGTISGGGEIEWLIDHGRYQRLTNEFRVEAISEVVSGSERKTVRFTFRIATQQQAIPSGQLAPLNVSPEFLIVPGKGIGSLTLDLPVAEFTSKLGQADETHPPEGSRAGEMFWRNRTLFVHIDPADPKRAVGLSIADRQYRTDKGIGFGSSEGAAILAHGVPPRTLDVMIPNLGGMRYLIYDDLGIAFGITSDRQHAARGPSHAPIGAVDMVTVFTPGNASKALSLP